MEELFVLFDLDLAEFKGLVSNFFGDDKEEDLTGVGIEVYDNLSFVALDRRYEDLVGEMLSGLSNLSDILLISSEFLTKI